MDTVSILIAFGLYLGFMVYLGWRYSKKTTTSSDFFLGGRQVGPWMTALSAEASDMSGWLLMGLPGVAYLGGMTDAFWTAIGLILGTYFNWLLVAKRLRKFSIHCNDSITIPEYFTNRFKDESHILSAVAVIIILVFFTVYTASGFVAVAKLFNSVFHLPYMIALVLGIVAILAYTLLGGYLAVCATDFVQGTLMFFALVITGIVMIISLGGPVQAIEAVNKLGNGYLNPFASGNGYGAKAIISALAWGLGYFGMPHILVRFMGIRSNQDVKISRRIAMVWVVIAFIAALLVGAFGRIYLLPMILEGSASETVLIHSLVKIFPAFIAGIFLCGIMAAAMSTADSQLLVASSAFSRDIFKAFIKKDASEKLLLLVSRFCVAGVAVIAFFFALDPNSSVFSLVSYAWAGFGATFGPIILLSLFWRRITRNGALSGLIAGFITVVVWKVLSGGIFDIYEILPGFIVCLVITVIVSLLGKNKNPEVEAIYDEFITIKD
ncbi:MAG: sodium/proline symporter [Treponema sp. CETP13]|nr:MAG: sodium/proline symporter [Treponema sp. CETP13]